MRTWVEAVLGAVVLLVGAGVANAAIEARTRAADFAAWESEVSA